MSFNHHEIVYTHTLMETRARNVIDVFLIRTIWKCKNWSIENKNASFTANYTVFFVNLPLVIECIQCFWHLVRTVDMSLLQRKMNRQVQPTEFSKKKPVVFFFWIFFSEYWLKWVTCMIETIWKSWLNKHFTLANIINN